MSSSARMYTRLATFILICSTACALPPAIESIIDGFKALTHLPRPRLQLRTDFWSKRDTTNATAGPSTNQSLWLLEDTYEGDTFFDNWWFWTGPDPTNGLVQYVDHDSAFAKGLAYVTPDKKVIMKGDNTTWLPQGVNRSSVRIQSNKLYTGGLFILDLNRAPWGCGVWPAFWTLGATTNWPNGGEIDIIEGVHDNVHNQVAWHTRAGCSLTAGNFTGTLVGQLDCDGNINHNSGCGIIDWSRVSYGETFDAMGGGLYVMKWDETGISTWYFYRVSLPPDIVNGTPDPDSWSTPSAHLSPQGCNPFEYFFDHAIIFDITFCGDWAGNSYATTPGCFGTCVEHLQDPSNFVNASWSINSLKVYNKQSLLGVVSSGSSQHTQSHLWVLLCVGFTLIMTHLGL